MLVIITKFENEVDYKDLQYLLAAEDYPTFHEFMFEANKLRNARVTHTRSAPKTRPAQRESSEDRQVRLAIEESLKQPTRIAQANTTMASDDWKRAVQASLKEQTKTSTMDEDEMLRLAFEESRLQEERDRLREEEELMMVMKAS